MKKGLTYSLDDKLYKCKELYGICASFYCIDDNGQYIRGKAGMNGDDRLTIVVGFRLHEMKLVEFKTAQIKLEL